MYFIHSRRMFVEYARPLSLFISALTCSGSSGEVISAESNFPMQKSPKIKCTLFFLLSSCIDVPMMELYRQSKYSCTQDGFFFVFFKIFFASPETFNISCCFMFGHSKKYVLEKHTYLSIAAETSLQHAVYTENTVENNWSAKRNIYNLTPVK